MGEDIPRAPVVGDAGYGNKTGFREALTALRVCPAHPDEKRTEPRPQEWLLVE